MNVLEKITGSRKYFLIFLIVVNAAIHAPFINLPPCSIHVWRQCNTLAVARNFYEEDMNILKPRVDRRYESTGVTGMQFPGYEWLLSCIYKITGEYFFVARLFTLLIFSLAIIFVYDFFLLVTMKRMYAAIAAWTFCWSPELFYHSINALPDILALTAAIGSCVFYLKWNRSKKIGLFYISCLLLTLAGLVKLQYLMFGAFILVFFLQDQKQRNFKPKEIFQFLVYGLISILLPLLWYQYAVKLIQTSNLHDFGIEFRPEKNIEAAFFILKKNILSDIPELLLNYGATIFVVVGLFVFMVQRKWKHHFFIPLLLASLVYISFHLIELHQMQVHQYYMMPLIFLLTPVATFGAKFLIEKKLVILTMIILFAQPVLACIRVLPARWLKENKAVPPELYIGDSRNQLRKAVNDSAKILAGPDESGCIYLYFLHKKGFGYESASTLKTKVNGKPYLEDCIDKGASVIYTTDSSLSADPELKFLLGNTLIHVGAFRVIELRKQ